MANARQKWFWLSMAIIGAFGSYFCMYMFRKPFTAAKFDTTFFNLQFKIIVTASQVLGYTVSKFLGIKVISEMKKHNRVWGLISIILVAEFGLILFAFLPAPVNLIGLFVNGLALGMVFGIVLGFLEGRCQTELLTAGLCASFVFADGFAKSLGNWLLEKGIAETSMPMMAGLIALLPYGLFVLLLSRVPPPDQSDLEARSERAPMTRAERLAYFRKYAFGLLMLMLPYAAITILRGIRADFAPEIWAGLAVTVDSALFTKTEIIVGLLALVMNAAVVLVANNRIAFISSLMISLVGFILIAVTILLFRFNIIDGFWLVVLIGTGLYIPYIAVHTTVFERMMAVTREKGNIGYLMYLVDAFGYLGIPVLLIVRNLVSSNLKNFHELFITLSMVASSVGIICTILAIRYFARLKK